MRPIDPAELAETLFEEIGDAAFIVDPETGGLVDVNPMALRLTGLSRADLLRLPLDRLFRADGDADLSRLRRALQTTQTFHSQEGYLLRRGTDSTWTPVNLTLTRLHTEPRLLGLVLARDVTERHRAEERLRAANAELERRVAERTADLARVNEALRAEVAEHQRTGAALALFRALIDRATDSIEVVDPDTARVLDVNETACLSHGYARAEYLALRVPDLDPTVRDPAVWARVVEALRRDGAGRHLGQHLRKDGSAFPVEVQLTHIRLDREYMVAVVRDVTDRVRAEEALRRSEAMLRRAQAIAHVGSWAYDVAGRAFHASEEANRMCGWAPGPHHADELFAVVHPDDRPRVRAALEAAAAGTAFELEHRFVVGGEVRWVHVRGEPEADARGRVVRVTGVTQDVTARRRLEEQFRQAQKMEAVGQLAGGVAHDFNNLLTVINGYCEVLLDDLQTSDPRRELVAAVRDAGERAAGLTGQLLAFSRKAIVAPKVLDLNEVVDSIGRMLRRLIGENVALTTTLSPGPARIRADPGQVEQVLLNLAVNARDAMPRGGKLAIETAAAELGAADLPDGPDLRPGRYVRLAVSDTGMGMTDEVRARIFEPFFTTKGPGQGTGLGLATVYGIVTQAGGHVRVESRVGAGTTFVVLLPEVPETSAPAGADVIRVAPRGTETVLVAEDEDGVRELARLALEMQGYAVLVARSGADALAAAAAHPGAIHLLVTDVVMPELGGRELADAVRARRPGTRVLYMSGYTDDAVVRHGVSDAADAFIQKPFTPLGLARKVRAVLDGGV